MYYIYMIRCKDNSIYTGITTNLEKRLREHLTRDKNCAKYTYVHIAKKLEVAWKTETRALASKLEYYIKKLKREEKESLIKSSRNFSLLLDEKIDTTCYTCMGKKELSKVKKRVCEK